uniref:SCO family protein n=1 Tax=Pararhizobium sp. IMCC3301 TaxID=3067904 RepID=UPI002740D3ED|nr:SCO family protein [Pararhizobium sp. IMCC3301]
MRLKQPAALLVAALAFAMTLSSSASAHHPGADLDKLMGSKERYFQIIDDPAPAFELADADGKIVHLSDFADKIVVLNFIFASCTDVCPVHSSLIADVQSKINATPMKDMVQFISVTTDPEVDTPEVLRSYGEPRGLDPHNWIFLTRRPGDAEDATRSLSKSYNTLFEPRNDGQQTHGVVTHIIDKGGRFAAKFHGLQFEPLNLVLYINGLTNIATPSAQPEERGLWEKFKDLIK